MDNLKRNAKENTSMDHSVDSAAESSVDRKLQEIFGLTDEMLLAEFEAAEKDTRGLPIPPPPADEFETIWSRIQEDASNAEKEKAPIIRVRFNWRRLAAIGLIACLMAGGLCFVAVGKKSYFYREKMLGGDADNTVLVNDDYKGDVNGEDEAYEIIEKELGITPLKLGYIPSEMKFRDLELRDGYAKIGFEYRGQVVYFIQSKYEKVASYKTDTDGIYEREAYNKWIKQKIIVKKENIVNSMERFTTSFIFKGAYYQLIGNMQEEEFLKMVTRLTP